MKNIFGILFLFFALSASAQFPGGTFGKNPIINQENFDQQRLSWGYFLGFNWYDYKIDYKNYTSSEILVDVTTGFNVGLIGDLRLNRFFNLRFEPGLYYTDRTLNYAELEGNDAMRTVTATYLNFPLLLKFSSVRTGNIKPFLVGGVSATLNLSSNSESTDDNYQDVFRVEDWTQNYEMGFGIDIYLEYFKFTPSIRGVFGMNNELIPDNDPNSPWTGNIDSLKSRGFLLNFTFQ
jgi:hypothetical protein